LLCHFLKSRLFYIRDLRRELVNLGVIEDGNDHVIAKQHIEYTDFPLPSMMLYGCWGEDGWVVMLPSEY
jgi:hypothetical protein